LPEHYLQILCFLLLPSLSCRLWRCSNINGPNMVFPSQ
jgi:hypothetical protein